MKKEEKEDLLNELVQLIIAIHGNIQNINSDNFYMYNEAMIQNTKRNIVSMLDVINKLK